MTTSVSKDQFSERYLKPMAVALASQIDKDGLRRHHHRRERHRHAGHHARRRSPRT
jgi:hypothetical protein